MRMQLVNTLGYTQNDILASVTHLDEEVIWNISPFDKRVIGDGNEIFKHINAFWDTRSSLQKLKIFEIFKKIKDVFDEIYDTSTLIQTLHPLIKEMYDEHKLNEINLWVCFHSNIILPHDLKKEYIASTDRPGTREKTYLESDYIDLVALTISLRVMIPIWGEFINRTRKETGNNFKEYYAYKLLSRSNLMHSDALEKLRVYTCDNIQDDRPMHGSIINGVGSEDFPTWLLSKVLVSRLCVGDISGSNPNSSLITYIWNYINHKVSNPSSSSFATMVKVKEFELGDGNNDHNASRLEGYKIKTDLPLGDIIILEQYMNNYVQLAQRLKPDINLDLLQLFLKDAQSLANVQIHKPQVTIAQYVLSPVFSPRGLVHLNKSQTITALAIAQTVLWENGHKVLSCLMSAIATSSEDRLMLGGIDSRSRIPKEIMDELMVLFPYNKKSAQRQKGKITPNVISAIDELAGLFSQRDWILTAADQFVSEITGKTGRGNQHKENFVNDVNRRFSCPQDIKILLAKLIVEIAK